MVLQDTPEPFHGVVFAVVRRLNRQFDDDTLIVSELDHITSLRSTMKPAVTLLELNHR